MKRLLAAALLVPLVGAAWGHDFHASLTEARYNAETGSLEVVARVFADDLERGVGRHRGERYRLDVDGQAPVFEYFKARLGFSGAGGRPLALHWIGMEMDVRQVWAYLEIPLDRADLDALILENRLFLESLEDQVNTLNLIVGDDRQTFVFRKGETRHAVHRATE